MAAMEQLYKPVPAIRSIAIAKIRPIRKKRPLQDICTQLDYEKSAQRLRKKFTAMATCNTAPSSGYGDSDPLGGLDSVQSSAGTLAVVEECRIRANDCAYDTGPKPAPELENRKGHRWEMASKLVSLYEAGVVEWKNKIGSVVSGRLDCITDRSGNGDAIFNSQVTEFGEDDDLLFDSKDEKGIYDDGSEEIIWHSMMVAMFSGMNEEPCSRFPGICNPTQVKVGPKSEFGCQMLGLKI